MTTALTVGMMTAAFAQESKPLGLSVRGGPFFPSMKKAKTDSGKQWIGVGVEYKLGDLQYGSTGKAYSASYSISADLYQKKNYRHAPVMLNYIGRMQDSIYYTAGAGVGFVRELDNTNNRKNHTTFSYQIGLGYEFSKSQVPLFVEARWIGSSKNSVNGWGVFLGARF